MRVIIFALCLVALATQSFGYEPFNTALHHCLAEIEAEDDVDLQDRTNLAIRCTMACVFRRQNILQEDSINMPMLKKEMYSYAALDQQTIERIAETCVDLAKNEEDICDKVNLINDCVGNEIDKY